jgi:hypothetical protein
VGWETYLDFGLANPGLEVLRARVRRVAAAGRLRVPEDRAVELSHAVADAMFEAVVRSVVAGATSAPAGDAATAAVALRSRVDELTVLRAAERTLLADWLDRIASA